MTTQLNNLSLATDDSDSRLTTSKFSKNWTDWTSGGSVEWRRVTIATPNILVLARHWAEFNSKQGKTGQEIIPVTNYIKILAVPKCKFSMVSFLLMIGSIFSEDLYRYHCSFESDVRFYLHLMYKVCISFGQLWSYLPFILSCLLRLSRYACRFSWNISCVKSIYILTQWCHIFRKSERRWERFE